MEKIVVDARGEACPLPVVKAVRALESMQEPGVLEVLVDNEIAVQNLTRMAAGRQLAAQAERRADGTLAVSIPVETAGTAPSAPATPVCIPDARGDMLVAVNGETMGHGDPELGRLLMKGFLYAVSQLPQLPKTMLFYNGGAHLTAAGSPVLGDLLTMEAQGVEILTCGTCLDFYGLKEQLAVGGVTNMYDIVERLSQAGRVIRP